MFSRGLAMQDLYNHSQAQEADTKFMKSAGEIKAKLDTLQGDKAVAYYQKGFYEDLTAARKAVRDGLPNDMARKLFDSQSLSTVGRSLFNGAGHAATENKKYAVGTADARIVENSNQALNNPEDETSFRQSVANTENQIRAKAQLLGQSPDQEQLAVEQAKSDLWTQRIKGLAKKDPLAAGKMLKEATDGGILQGEDIAKASNIVQQQRNAVGSRMISHQVNAGIGTQMGSKIVPIEQAQEAIAQIESGGRYSLQTDTGSRHGIALGKYQVMSGFLPEFLREAGMPPMTKEEFLASPKAQDQLFNIRFGALMEKTGSANGAAARWIGLGKPDAFGTDAPKYVARFNAALARNAPLATKIQEGQRLAAEQAPDDLLFPDYVEQRIKTDNDRIIAVKRDTEFQNRQVIEDGLMGGKDGKLPTTVEELTNTPEKQQAWEDLLPQTQRRYMGVLSKNAKGDTNWTDDTLREYQRLKGQAASDPADFIDMDVISSNLPNSAKRELINLQGRLKGKAEGDPRITKAMQILGPDLQAAGIDKRDKDTYYGFVGALSDQLQQFADDNKKPPKADEVKLIGARLLQQQKSNTFFGSLFGSKTPTFQVPVPSDEAEKIKLDPAWARLGISPNDQQIQRIYTRDLFNRLYGKATGSPSGAPVPNAPVSR